METAKFRGDSKEHYAYKRQVEFDYKLRFALYFTIIYVTNFLKMLTLDQKKKQTFTSEYKLIVFFSICEIIEYLTVSMSKNIDKK